MTTPCTTCTVLPCSHYVDFESSYGQYIPKNYSEYNIGNACVNLSLTQGSIDDWVRASADQEQQMHLSDMYRFMVKDRYNFPGQEEKVTTVVYNFAIYQPLTRTFIHRFVRELDIFNNTKFICENETLDARIRFETLYFSALGRPSLKNIYSSVITRPCIGKKAWWWIEESANSRLSLEDMDIFMRQEMHRLEQSYGSIWMVLLNFAKYQKLTETFIREFKHLLRIPMILKYQTLSKEFADWLRCEYKECGHYFHTVTSNREPCPFCNNAPSSLLRPFSLKNFPESYVDDSKHGLLTIRTFDNWILQPMERFICQEDMYRFMRQEMGRRPGPDDIVLYNFVKYQPLTVAFIREFFHELRGSLVLVYNTKPTDGSDDFAQFEASIPPPPTKPCIVRVTYDIDTCAICRETLETSETRVLTCGHPFHNECIDSWLERVQHCPCCRETVVIPYHRVSSPPTVDIGQLQREPRSGYASLAEMEWFN
jgi:hypothetical protein